MRIAIKDELTNLAGMWVEKYLIKLERKSDLPIHFKVIDRRLNIG